MRHRTLAALLTPPLALALAACAGSPVDPGATAPTEVGDPSAAAPRPAPSRLALPGEPAPPPSGEAPVASDVTEAAVLDLAAHLGIPREEVTVVSVEEVTWPDGSLGCPEPGHVYTQVLTDGTLVVLRAGGSTFRYHAAAGRAPFRCESHQVPHPADY